ncbi:MAG: Gfo/Idh/MocA family oxidoreductase [Rhodobacteraceae bacterium]|nr:Gfo/Idh/MocA family oxidoreductase [Paracoccaceae bacterium]MCY4141946.1 Gfo/Idh/MocA family oxidoreductase [Paracoccaceae bacterium]
MDKSNGPRVGVIGCGNWGRHLVRNFHEMGLLAGVSDIRNEAAHSMHGTYGVAPLTADRMFASSEIDAVVIATPAEEHFHLGIRAIESGKHVFVEKPISVTDTEADALVTASRKADRILMVGHVLRYHPCFLELHRIVRSGGIGRVNYMRTTRAANHGSRRNENALWGFAPHDVSMMLALAGEMPAGILAHGDHAAGRRGADVALAMLDFPSGLKGHLFVSWFNHVKEQKLVVSGDSGVIVFDDCEPWERKLVVYRYESDGGNPPGHGDNVVVNRAEPLRAECDHFVGCIRNGSNPVTGGAEGAAVVRVLTSMIRSMQVNGPVSAGP